ncbi:hypothetical protein BaRGS_00004524 [Batillaria attramentaria]|uniref:Uncharacterized protein n=1 Tax=Batillaria attramentaria TaxID=370345 RepID=A0ABD0LXG8_9CAEN
MKNKTDIFPSFSVGPWFSNQGSEWSMFVAHVATCLFVSAEKARNVCPSPPHPTPRQKIPEVFVASRRPAGARLIGVEQPMPFTGWRNTDGRLFLLGFLAGILVKDRVALSPGETINRAFEHRKSGERRNKWGMVIAWRLR